MQTLCAHTQKAHLSACQVSALACLNPYAAPHSSRGSVTAELGANPPKDHIWGTRPEIPRRSSNPGLIQCSLWKRLPPGVPPPITCTFAHPSQRAQGSSSGLAVPWRHMGDLLEHREVFAVLWETHKHRETLQSLQGTEELPGHQSSPSERCHLSQPKGQPVIASNGSSKQSGRGEGRELGCPQQEWRSQLCAAHCRTGPSHFHIANWAPLPLGAKRGGTNGQTGGKAGQPCKSNGRASLCPGA